MVTFAVGSPVLQSLVYFTLVCRLLLLFLSALIVGIFTFGSLFLRFGIDNFGEALLQSNLLKLESILVPNKVWNFSIYAVALHARLEKAEDIRVVWITSKSQTSAIVHVILELLRLVQAEFVKTDLLLLSLNVSVFLSLASAWQALPGKGSS